MLKQGWEEVFPYPFVHFPFWISSLSQKSISPNTNISTHHLRRIPRIASVISWGSLLPTCYHKKSLPFYTFSTLGQSLHFIYTAGTHTHAIYTNDGMPDRIRDSRPWGETEFGKPTSKT